MELHELRPNLSHYAAVRSGFTDPFVVGCHSRKLVLAILLATACRAGPPPWCEAIPGATTIVMDNAARWRGVPRLIEIWEARWDVEGGLRGPRAVAVAQGSGMVAVALDPELLCRVNNQSPPERRNQLRRWRCIKQLACSLHILRNGNAGEARFPEGCYQVISDRPSYKRALETASVNSSEIVLVNQKGIAEAIPIILSFDEKRRTLAEVRSTVRAVATPHVVSIWKPADGADGPRKVLVGPP